MSNVLPLSAQKSVWSFYRSRFLFVGSIAAILVAILAFAALLPAYMATRSLGKSLGDSESMLPASEEDQNERALILRARTLISELAPVAERPGVFEALTEALEARPNGIVIQRMQIKKEDRQTIVIGGTASDRSRISAYRDALIKNSRFEQVDVPVGALAGAEGGQFSITLTGAF